MGDSWEDAADGRAGGPAPVPKPVPAPKLSISAKPFVFNPGAKPFVPPGAVEGVSTPVPPPPAPVTAPSPPPPLAPVSEIAAKLASVEVFPSPCEAEDNENDEDDDPLWKFALKVTAGDADKAEGLLSEPEAFLTKYPEARPLFEGAATETGPSSAVAAAVKTDSKVSAADSPQPPKAIEEDEGAVVDVGELVDEDPREHLNLVFIGHVDAGKSTMSGQILYLTGQVDKRTIEKFEREAKQLNRESWFLAFIMDTNEEERAKGKTVEVGRAHFETADKRYTIMDAPGHKNYVPNMIAGAVQADVGILVISARRGEFETGFERGGQTREHALLAKTLGVKYLVVVINKMDDPTVRWSKDRFDECVSKLKPFLNKSCGYAIKKEVKFVPVSGLTGANILEPVAESVCPWWSTIKGEHNTNESTLIECLDKLHIEGRDSAAPLRIPVLDRYHDRGTVALGKVESGSVRVGMKVMAMPTQNVFEVQSIYINELAVRSAKPGENVQVKLVGAGVEDVQKGFVLCEVGRPCHKGTMFECSLLLVDLLEHRPIFSPGYSAVAHLHTTEEECTVVELVSLTDPKTKEVKQRPRFARLGAVVTARLRTAREICCEPFERVPQLGRLTLRDEGKTIAIGKVTKVASMKKVGAASGGSA